VWFSCSECRRCTQECALTLRDGQRLHSRERLKARLKLIPTNLTLPSIIAVGSGGIDQVQKSG